MVDKTYRNRLADVLNNNRYRVATQLRAAIANVILTNVDEQIVHAWGHLSDMGIPKSEFIKIKAIVKRKL